MKITVIDNYDSFVYNLVRYLREIEGMTIDVVKNDQIDYRKLEKADALVLSPGPGIPEEAGELLQIIDRFHIHKPMLGVCLGHQALGQFFGAGLQPHSEMIHGKVSLMQVLEKTGIFVELENEIEVGRYHSWILDSALPDELQLIGRGEKGEVMAFQHRKLPICGVQFHPESILTPDGRKMIQNWVTELKNRTT